MIPVVLDRFRECIVLVLFAVSFVLSSVLIMVQYAVVVWYLTMKRIKNNKKDQSAEKDNEL